jgi:hypothetical protein
VSLQGRNIDGKSYRAILDCLVNATDYLTVKAMDLQGSFAIHLLYNIPQIIEQGQLPIGDIEKFESFLGRFDINDEVTVSTQGNKIVIERESPKKIARIPMAAHESILSKNAIIIDKLTWSDLHFPITGKTHYNLAATIKAEDVTSLFDDGNVLKQRILPWRIDNNILYMKIGTETAGEFETEIQLEDLKRDESIHSVSPRTSTAFGNGLDNIFSNLSGKVTIFLQAEVEICPLVVKQESEKYNFLALLAPYVVKE